jgi:hypothetical protein
MMTGIDPALSVTVWVEVVPTTILPKLKLDGEAVKLLSGILVALPERAIDTLVAFCAETLNVPVKLPVVFGTNFNWILMLWPTPRLDGVVIPANLKAPLMVALVRLTVVVPLLRKVT